MHMGLVWPLQVLRDATCDALGLHLVATRANERCPESFTPFPSKRPSITAFAVLLPNGGSL